tara:strand:+ start:7811 stop:8224 length:414 start_codon:yes stop_codon:yes gene_type:complete
MENKYAIVREFLYGYDWSEFSDDNGLIPIIYDSKEDAQASLDEHIRDVNDAYEDGDMDEPYDNDMAIAEVTVNVIKHKHLSVEFIEDQLEVLGLDHPLVDQIEDRIYDSFYKKIPFDQQELSFMSNEITNAIKELNQ